MKNQIADKISTITLSRAVGFNYYDGYENGIGISTENIVYRFSSVGDSYSRMYRSFIFSQIDMGWWQRACTIEGIVWDNSKSLFAFINTYSAELCSFFEEINLITTENNFVGISDIGLDCIKAVPLDLKIKKNLEDPAMPNKFREVHRHLKGYR